MADSNDKIIPYLSEDMGEGVMDFLDGYTTTCPECGSAKIWKRMFGKLGCMDCQHEWD